MSVRNHRGTVRCAFYFTMWMAALPLAVITCQATTSFLHSFPSLPPPQLSKIEPPTRYRVEVYTTQSKTIRHTTAYVAGEPSQTDDTPCIAADGTNICVELNRGEKICAANFVPIGTRLYIPGFGICTVKDRMNKRYRNRVDLAMETGRKREAGKWGKKPSEVHILK